MALEPAQVAALYRDERLTMQQIADRFGVTKSRVHQVLRDAGVDTSHGAVPRPRPAKPGLAAPKAYRAYQMTGENVALVERLAAALATTRTAVVNRAVEELADRVLPGWREAATGEGAKDGPKARRGKVTEAAKTVAAAKTARSRTKKA